MPSLPRLTSLQVIPSNTHDQEVTHLEINDRNKVILWSDKKRLAIIDCNTSYLRDLQGISRFPQLERLTCQRIPITSLKGIGECSKITSIKCDDCSITSLQDLSGCNKLRSFSCQGNNITSLQGLQHLPELSVVICNDNLVTSLQGLRGCHKLTRLRCQGNSLTSLEGLEECHELQMLYLRGNPLTTLQGLATVPEILAYDRKSFPVGYNYFQRLEIARLAKAYYRVYRMIRPKLTERIIRFQRIWRERHYEKAIVYQGSVINRLCYIDLAG